MADYHYTHLGPVSFWETKEYRYLAPDTEVNENCPQKEEIHNCPLCGAKHYLTVGKFEMDDIIDKWANRVEFNPVADVYRHAFLEKRRCLNCGLYFYNYHLPDSEALYKNLMETISYYPVFREEYGAASAVLEKVKPESLLEIGCGLGYFLERVQNMVPYVLGSEYNHEAAEICQQKGLNVSTEDITNLNRRFDVVCAFEVLEHVWQTKPFIENLLTLLKPGGKLMFGTPNPEGILRINGNSMLNLPPHHQFDFSYQAYEYLAEIYNLKIWHYECAKLEYYQYEKFVANVTEKALTGPDIKGYLEAKKEYSGHSHFVVFEKQ